MAKCRRRHPQNRAAVTDRPSVGLRSHGSGDNAAWNGTSGRLSAGNRQASLRRASRRCIRSRIYFLIDGTDHQAHRHHGGRLHGSGTKMSTRSSCGPMNAFVCFQYEISPLNRGCPSIPNWRRFLGWRPWHHEGPGIRKATTQAARASGARSRAGAPSSSSVRCTALKRSPSPAAAGGSMSTG